MLQQIKQSQKRSEACVSRLYCDSNQFSLQSIDKDNLNFIDVQDYIIVGSGINALLNAFFISEKFPKSTISLITKSSQNFKDFSTTWGVGLRHISIFEGINFLSPNHIDDICKTVDQGGWIGKSNKLTKDEEIWLESRKKSCISADFCSRVSDYYKINNFKSVKKWNYFVNQNQELFDKVDFEKNVYMLSNNQKFIKNLAVKKKNFEVDDISKKSLCKVSDFDAIGFSFNAKKLCLNLIKKLKKRGINFIYKAEISHVEFINQKEIVHIESKEKNRFFAKNYLFCLGAYGANLLKYFNLNHKINCVFGVWMNVQDVCAKHAFKYHYFEDNHLKCCQSYTPTKKDTVVVGSGCAWVGERYDNACSMQIDALVNSQKAIVRKLFPQKK